MSHDDFAFEPVKGLPEELPDGEQMLWQGAPDWRHLAVRAFHVRKIALYFAIVMMVKAGSALSGGATVLEAAVGASGMLALAVTAIGIFCLIAWLTEKTTVYTITSQRVVMRIGIAISFTINIPFARIQSASVRAFNDNSGDIPLHLDDEHRMSYIVMYPHVRPWRFLRPQPMLRSLNNVESVAGLLADALAKTSVGAVDSRTEKVSNDAGLKPASQPQASVA